MLTSNLPTKRMIVLLIFLLGMLSACDTVSSLVVAPGGTPTTVQIRRVNLQPGNHYLPFLPRTITNQQTVQQLYTAIQILPKRNITGSSPAFCPHDAGLEYQIDILQQHTLIQEAIFNPGGCPSVRIGANDVRAPDEAFAQLFAQVVGVAKTELVPAPLFSCTPHSPCPSSPSGSR